MAFTPPERLAAALGEHSGPVAGEPAGTSSADWLAALPGLVTAAVERRGLTVERVHLPGGRSSVVLLVRCPDGTPAALKLAPPGARPDLERAALVRWDGRGAVRLLETDADTADDGALLLERLRPDVSVRSLPQDKSMLEAAGALRRLWVPPGPVEPAGATGTGGFETVAERTARVADAARRTDGAGPEVMALLETALAARRALLDAAPGEEAVLLHGAFRQSKVLAGERLPWLAVGPEPLVGERAFDLARLVRDRVEDLVARESGPATARRLMKRLAESLEVAEDRLRGWTLFRAVVSGVRALGAGRGRDAELLLEFASWL